MKFIGSLLAIYILLLATVPCCQFDDCPEDKTEQSASHESGDEDCGNCSPFFSCEGCNTATISLVNPALEFKPALSVTVFNEYQPAALPRVDSEFWQPPKLS